MRLLIKRFLIGYDNGGSKWFQVPEYYPDIKTESRVKDENGIRYFSKGSIMWYTNLDITKRHEDLILYKTYNPQEYPKYDNYDAINVDVTAEIPCDYAGAMGVTITFMDKYNPEQFEIIQFRKGNDEKDLYFARYGFVHCRRDTDIIPSWIEVR